MTSASVFSCGGATSPPLQADLTAVGIEVRGLVDIGTMVQDVIRTAPDVVVCYENHPGDALFAGTAALHDAAPCPVIVFTSDPDADKIERAARSGIHAYVINGYGLHRLRAVIHVAQARFRHDQLLRDELSEVRHRFNERKLVDRAKGIIMRLRNIPEEEAFAVLRSAAMQSKQRIGQVAQQVIDATRFADAVNRAGQLRMLSQRIVKLFALMCAEVEPDLTQSLCRESIEQVEANLAFLSRTLSKATFGDLLDAVTTPWSALKAGLRGAPGIGRIADIDRLAERLLGQAEALTKNLELAGFAAALQVINMSGRQRMLSQRMAKQGLIALLLGGDVALRQAEDALKTEAAFVAGFAYLQSVPLSSPEIRVRLDAAAQAWSGFKAALTAPDPATAKVEIAALSETLLAEFGQLTDLYERSMQQLMA